MQAVLCETHQDFTAAGDGAILPVWRGDPADGVVCQLMIKCPGCGQVSGLQIRPYQDPGQSAWDMSGFSDAITLKPSVHHKDVCGWHGWLQDCQWRKC